MVPYSIDLRERVLMAVDAGEGTQEQIAERFRVSARWIRKLLARRAATGSIAPEPNRGGPQALDPGGGGRGAAGRRPGRPRRHPGGTARGDRLRAAA